MQKMTRQGLSTTEAERRLKENGENKLEGKKKPGILIIFLSQFKDIMVLILLAATLVSALMGEVYDALTMIAIVLLDAILGFIQEYKTEKTLEALEAYTAPMATVIRDGAIKRIDAKNIVIGDIFMLETGDRVPADAKILEENDFSCDESMLTGESEAVKKTDFTYMGTTVIKGRAICEAIATGMQTKMGSVTRLIEDAGDDKTPLQRKLGRLGIVLSIICLGVCVVVTIAGIIRGEPLFDMLLTGITIAIAAIPEGLPATVTIALALAVRRMLNQRALVSKLHSVETLGCTTVICTDKTGTITQNKMSAIIGWADEKEYSFTDSNKAIADSEPLAELLKCAILCNNASLSPDEDSISIGDPTEIALLLAGERYGITQKSLSAYKRVNEIPFDSKSKMMSVDVRVSGRVITYSKGACDIILDKCSYLLTESGIIPLNKKLRKDIIDKFDSYAQRAMRVLAFSFKSDNSEEIFIGMIGLQDPPRKEARRAIASCKKAGIRVVMITGDYKLTASAIAKQVGILGPNDEVISSEELTRLTDTQLIERIRRVRVFARVSPEDKLRIVKAYKALGETVAMTGDGINDAAAIKEADIGVAMGISGTDVSKQSADIVLLDDNFATLTQAIRQGRTIYSNIRKFVRYLISCNIGEVIVMLLSIISGLPIVLLPTQLLLVNLITDGLPAIALGLEESEESIMQKKPTQFSGDFFSSNLLQKILTRGIFIGLCTLGCFIHLLNSGAGLAIARTGALMTLIISQLIHVFECRSEEKSVFKMNPFKNKALVWSVLISCAALIACVYASPLQSIMQTASLTPQQLLISLGFASCVPIISGVVMLFRRKE